MRCECKECSGSGWIDCPDCDGMGHFDFSIVESPPEKGHPNYEALVDCYLDAVSARIKTRELIKLKPEHAESYQRQLQYTLEIIEREAEEIQKGVA